MGYVVYNQTNSAVFLIRLFKVVPANDFLYTPTNNENDLQPALRQRKIFICQWPTTFEYLRPQAYPHFLEAYENGEFKLASDIEPEPVPDPEPEPEPEPEEPEPEEPPNEDTVEEPVVDDEESTEDGDEDIDFGDEEYVEP